MSIVSYERKGNLGIATDEEGREVLIRHYPRRQLSKKEYFAELNKSYLMCEGPASEVDWDDCDIILEGYESES